MKAKLDMPVNSIKEGIDILQDEGFLVKIFIVLVQYTKTITIKVVFVIFHQEI